jgi:beta-ureidopropionase
VVRVAIALGSNLSDRAAHIAAGIAALRQYIPDLIVSSLIETPAEGVGPQPDFLNGAAAGSWRGSAESLLALLQGIEHDCGRERPFPGAPRTLDLDLIFFGDAVIDSPGLAVPHPRFRERSFVLTPLAEIAADWLDPVTGSSVEALRQRQHSRAGVRIALVQATAGASAAANVERGLTAVRTAAANGARLVTFAELAFTPFFPVSRAEAGVPLDRAETVPGPTTDAFCHLAAELGVVIVLNLYEREGTRAYDSSPVINADGCLLGTTRMLHVAQMPGCWEQDYYTPGDHGMPVYDTRVGRVGVAICYDRHYPEVMRCLGLQAADLVVVPQAGTIGEWPDGLYEAELRVAAFQNGYFTALANRVGREGSIEFAGESFVCDPAGRVVAKAPAADETIVYADLDYGLLANSHARRLFMRDRRHDLTGALMGQGSR